MERTFTVRYASVPLSEIKGRLIRNPGYGSPHVSIHGWCWRPAISSHRKPLFQEALRDSIREEGLRNPVIIYALEEGCFLSFGGSRLRAAIDLGLETIPAIVNDYADRFPDAPEVTIENFSTFFTDVPDYFEITDKGADTHYSLERNRRHTHDAKGMAWAGDAEFIRQEFSWIDRA